MNVPFILGSLTLLVTKINKEYLRVDDKIRRVNVKYKIHVHWLKVNMNSWNEISLLSGHVGQQLAEKPCIKLGSKVSLL